MLDLGLQTPPEFSPHLCLLAGALSCMKCRRHLRSRHFFEAMEHARFAEPWTSKIQVLLLDELDRFMTNVAVNSFQLERHWSLEISFRLPGSRFWEKKALDWQTDFMTCAVSRGFCEYVKEKKQSIGLRKEGRRPLLFYVVPDIWADRLPVGFPEPPICEELVCLLLDDYGDMNGKFEGKAPGNICSRL